MKSNPSLLWSDCCAYMLQQKALLWKDVCQISVQKVFEALVKEKKILYTYSIYLHGTLNIACKVFYYNLKYS